MITKLVSKIIGLILACVIPQIFAGNLSPVGSNFLKPYTSNKEEFTFYEFNFQPDNEILENAIIQITFPPEYSFYAFSNLECQVATQNSPFEIIDCEYIVGNIINIKIERIFNIEMNIVIGTIENPSLVDGTSQFRIATLLNDVLIDSNQAFGVVSFSEQPVIMINPDVEIVSNRKISEGSTYEFKFTTTNNYEGQNTIRFHFPPGFNSLSAMCDVRNLIGPNPETKIFHNNRIIGCIKTDLYISAGQEQVIRIVNMVNPHYSGVFEEFRIELMDGDSSVVKEKIDFIKAITVDPGDLEFTYEEERDRAYKAGTLQFGFKINLVNKVEQDGRLYINFTDPKWNLEKQTCQIVSGFNELPGQDVTCNLVEGANSYRIENFESIGPEKRLVVIIDAITPNIANNYAVDIATYTSKEEAFIDKQTRNILINDTFGVNDVWKVHPLNSEVKLKAREAGPLEILLFLRNKLDQTNVGTYGKFRIDIFPAIDLPDINTYGQLSCYFYGNIPAKHCTWHVVRHDTGHPDEGNIEERTTIYVSTPEFYSFKESEIPLTITTQGAKAGYEHGIKLHQLNKRYTFQIYMFNDDVDFPTQPQEFYFTEWIPDQQKFNNDTMTQLTASSDSRTAGTYSDVTVEFTQLYLDNYLDSHYGYDRNYKFRIRLSSNLQFEHNNPTGIHHEYPCNVEGTIIGNTPAQTDRIRCEMVYVSGNIQQSYLDVYGFNTANLVNGNTLKVNIPRVKVPDPAPLDGIYSNFEQWIYVSLLEETPGERDDIVIINDFSYEFSSLQTPISEATSGVTITLSDTTPNQNPSYQFQIASNGISGVTKVVIVFPDYTLTDTNLHQRIPNFNLFNEVHGHNLYERFGSCGTGSTACHIYGEDVRTIVIEGTMDFTSSKTFSFDMNSNSPAEKIFTNPATEAKDQEFYIHLLKGGACVKKYKIQFDFTPKAIATSAFALTDTATDFYKDHEYLYQVSFTTMNPVPEGGRIVISIDKLVPQKTTPLYNVTSGLTAASDKGIIFTISDPTPGDPHIIWLDNLGAIAASTAITVDLLFIVEVPATHAAATADISTQWPAGTKIDEVTGVTINLNGNSINTTPDIITTFEVVNPRIAQTPPQAGYIGPLELNLGVRASGSGDVLIKLWDFKLPRNLHPLICEQQVTGVWQVFDCRAHSHQVPTDPLVITLDNPTVTAGTRKVRISTEEGSPRKGLIWPAKGGIKKIQIELLDSVKNQQGNVYFNLMPPKMHYLDVDFLTRSTLYPNIFTLSFMQSEEINSYKTGGRIYIQFPQSEGFANNLGYYTEGDEVPCIPLDGLYQVTNDPEITCRYVSPKQATNDNIIIEVLNFAPVGSYVAMELMVGRIDIPLQKNLKISVLTLNFDFTQAVGEEKTLLNYDEFTIFLNANSDAITPQSEQVVPFTAPATGPTTGYLGYPGVLENQFWKGSQIDEEAIVIVSLPLEIPQIVVDKQNTECDAAKYDYCYAMVTKDVNWIVYKIKTGQAIATGTQAASINIQLPACIQISDINGSGFGAFFFNKEKQYLTNTPFRIASAALTATVNSYSASAAQVFRDSVTEMEGKLVAGIDHVEYQVSFTLSVGMAEGSRIDIKAPDELQKLYPNCRSAITLGSKLYSISGVNRGDIGCSVYNSGGSNYWKLENYKAISETEQVIMILEAQNPAAAAAGGSLNFGVMSYCDLAGTKLMASKADIALTTAITAPNTAELNPNAHYTFKNTKIARIDAGIQDLKLKVQFSTQVTAKQVIVLHLYQTERTDATNQKTGFDMNDSNYKICYFQRISDGYKIPGWISTYTDDNADGDGKFYVELEIYAQENLLTSEQYVIILTTINKDQADDSGGFITYPTEPGQYQMIISQADTTQRFIQYFESYGQEFKVIDFRSYIPRVKLGTPDHVVNYLDLRIQPEVAIADTHEIVIEIETQAASGSNPYYKKGTSAYKTQEILDFDIVEMPTPGSLDGTECRYIKGDEELLAPTKIVCNVPTQIENNQYARYVFKVNNPRDITRKYFIPVSIYSYDPATNKKTNFNFFPETWVVDFNDQAAGTHTLNPTITSTDIDATTTFQFGTPTLKTNDVFILQYPGDILAESKIATTAGSDREVLYCKKIQAIILRNTGATDITGNIQVTDHLNPSYYIPEADKLALGYHVTYTDLTTEHFDFTSEGGWVNSITPTIAVNNIGFLHSDMDYEEQNNDLVFDINVDFVQNVGVYRIEFSAPFAFLNKQCGEHHTSTVRIQQCFIDGLIVYLVIYNKDGTSYPNGSTFRLAFQTRNFGLDNKASGDTFDQNLINIQAYKWTDTQTMPDPTVPANVAFRLFDETLPAGSILSRTAKIADPAEQFEVFYDRYVDNFTPFKNTHRFAIELDITLPFALTADVDHSLVVKLQNDNIVVPTQAQHTDTQNQDTYKNVPACYIDGIPYTCTFGSGPFSITISTFNSKAAFTLGAVIHLKATTINPLEYPKEEGFTWNHATETNVIYNIELEHQNGSDKAYFKSPSTPVYQYGSTSTYLNPEIKQIKLAHAQMSYLNYLQIEFNLPVAGVDTLIFEFDVAYYSTAFMHSFAKNGERFPCSAGTNLVGDILCRFSESTGANDPMRIYVSDFTYSTTNDNFINFVIISPDQQISSANPSFFHVNLVAYGNSGSNEISGTQYFGRHDFTESITFINANQEDVSDQEALVIKERLNHPSQGITITPKKSETIVANGITLVEFILSDAAFPNNQVCDLSAYTQGGVNYYMDSGVLKAFVAFEHSASETGGYDLNNIKCKSFEKDILIYHLSAEASSTPKIFTYTIALASRTTFQTNIQTKAQASASLPDIVDTSKTVLEPVFTTGAKGYAEVTINLSDIKTVLSGEGVSFDTDMQLILTGTTSQDFDFIGATKPNFCGIKSGSSITPAKEDHPILCKKNGAAVKYEITNWSDLPSTGSITFVFFEVLNDGSSGPETITVELKHTYTDEFSLIYYDQFDISYPALVTSEVDITANSMAYDQTTNTLNLDFTMPFSTWDFQGNCALKVELLSLTSGNWGSTPTGSMTVIDPAATPTVLSTISTTGSGKDFTVSGDASALANGATAQFQLAIVTQDLIPLLENKNYIIYKFTFTDNASTAKYSYHKQILEVSPVETTGPRVPVFKNLVLSQGAYSELQMQVSPVQALAVNGNRFIAELVEGFDHTEPFYGFDSSKDVQEYPCNCGNSQKTCTVIKQGAYDLPYTTIVFQDVVNAQNTQIWCYAPFLKNHASDANVKIRLSLVNDPYLGSTQSGADKAVGAFYQKLFTVGTSIASSPPTDFSAAGDVLNHAVTTANDIGTAMTGYTVQIKKNGATQNQPYVMFGTVGSKAPLIDANFAAPTTNINTQRTYTFKDTDGKRFNYVIAEYNNVAVGLDFTLQGGTSNLNPESYDAAANVYQIYGQIIDGTTQEVLHAEETPTTGGSELTLTPDVPTTSMIESTHFATLTSDLEALDGLWLIKVQNIEKFEGSKNIYIDLADDSQTFSTCGAVIQDSINEPLNCVVSKPAAHRFAVTLVSQKSGLFSASSRVIIAFKQTNPDKAAHQMDHQLTDGGTGALIADTASGTLTTTGHATMTTRIATMNILPVRSKIFQALPTAKLPLKLQFRIQSGITPDADYEVWVEFKTTNPFPSTGEKPKVLFRHYTTSYTYTEYETICSYDGSTRILKITSIIGSGVKLVMAAQTQYELVIVDNSPSGDMSIYGLTNTDTQVVNLYVAQDSTPTAHDSFEQGLLYKYHHNTDKLQLKKFYNTRRILTESSSFYFEIILPQSQTTLTADKIAANYLEIEFVGFPIADQTGLATGKTVDCDLADTFAQGTNNVKPICQISQRSGSDDLVIVVDHFSYASGARLGITLDTVIFPDFSAAQLMKDFTCKFSYYYNDGTSNTLYQSEFKKLFVMDTTPSPTSTADASNKQLTNSGSDLGETGVTFSYSYSWPATTSTAYGNKYSIVLHQPNILVDLNTVAIDVGGSGQTILYINRNTGLIVLDQSGFTSGSSYNIQIKNLATPTVQQLTAYAVTTDFTMLIYTSFGETNDITFKYPDISAVTPELTSSDIASLAIANPTKQWILGEVITVQVSLTMDLGTWTNAEKNAEKIDNGFLKLTTAGTELIDCYDYKLTTSHTGVRCSVQKAAAQGSLSTPLAQAVRITGLMEKDWSDGQAITFKLVMRVSSATVDAVMEIFDTSETLYPVKKDMTTITLGNILPTYATLTKFTLLNKKYAKNYYEVIETDLNTSGEMDKFQFIYTSTGMTTTNNLALTLTGAGSSSYNVYSTKVAADNTLLMCKFFKQEDHFEFSSHYIMSACTVTDTDNDPLFTRAYAMVNPEADLPAGTYLVQIGVDLRQTTSTDQLFLMPQAPERTEVLFKETGGSTNANTLIINPVNPMTTSGIVHWSLSKNQYDFMEVSIQPSQLLISGSDSFEAQIIVELDSNMYGDEPGYATVYTDANVDAYTVGSLLSVKMDSGFDAKCILQSGDLTDGIHFRYVITVTSAIPSASVSTLTIPKLKNPTNHEVILSTKVYVRECPDTGACYVNSQYEFTSNAMTSNTSPTGASNLIIEEQNNLDVLSTDLRFKLKFQIFSFINTDTLVVVDWDVTGKGIAVEEYGKFDTETNYQRDHSYESIHCTTFRYLTGSKQYINQKAALDLVANKVVTPIKVKKVTALKNLETKRTISAGTVNLNAAQPGVGDAIIERLAFPATLYDAHSHQQSLFVLEITLSNVPAIQGIDAKIKIEMENDLKVSGKEIGNKCLTDLNEKTGWQLDCYKVDDYNYVVQGFDDVADGDTIKFRLFLDNINQNLNYQFTGIDIVTNDADENVIISYNNLRRSSGNFQINDYVYFPNALEHITDYQEYPVFSDRYEETHFKVDLVGYTTADTIKISLPQQDSVGSAAAQEEWKYQTAAGAKQYFQYKIENFWVDNGAAAAQTELILTENNGSVEALDIDDTEILVRAFTTKLPKGSAPYLQQNGLFRPSITGIYNFKVERLQSSTLMEIKNTPVVLKPERHTDFKAVPIMTDQGEWTLVRLDYELKHPMLAGDEFWVEFVTHNGKYEMFLNDLGFDLEKPEEIEVECVEHTPSGFTPPRIHIASAGSNNPQIPCHFEQGVPEKKVLPRIRIVPTTNAGVVGSTLTVFVGPVKNPENFDKAIVIMSHRRKCRDGDNAVCAISESSDFWLIQPTCIPLTAGAQTIGKVLETNVDHTYSACTGNKYLWVKKDPANHKPTTDHIPHLYCTAPSGSCLTFPKKAYHLLIDDSTAQGVNNGYFRGRNNWIFVGSDEDGKRLCKEQTIGEDSYYDYKLPTGLDEVVVQANTTLSSQDAPGIQYFVKSYKNVVELNIDNLWHNDEVRKFVISRPNVTDLYFVTSGNDNSENTGRRNTHDLSYCNATYIRNSDIAIPEENKPYPFRFQCTVSNDYIQITRIDKATYSKEDWKNPTGKVLKNWELDIRKKFKLRVYFKMYIPWAQGGQTLTFGIEAHESTHTSYDCGDGIVGLTHDITVSNLAQPILRSTKFNTKSFYDRKGRIGDKVEYYMLLKPQTLSSDYVAHRQIYRLPEEFGYPSIINLDQCVMYGSRNFGAKSCVLDRRDRYTYVTFDMPYYWDSSSNYRNMYEYHNIQIVRLSHTNLNNLFQAPMLPGEHYNMSLGMFDSGSQLIEKTETNLTKLHGIFLDVGLMDVNFGNDAETNSMFEFKFTLGDIPIQAGYEVESTTIWSKIKFIFINQEGYENDLGTRFLQLEEVGCQSKTLTTKHTGRLKCTIDLGTSPEDLPTIIVEGYDKIPAATEVIIFITGLKTLPTDRRVAIRYGVELTYNYLNRATAFIYEPTNVQVPQATTDITPGITVDTATQVEIEGDNEILGRQDISLTFAAGADPIKDTDYLAFQFPKDFFIRYSDFADVGCVDVTNGNADCTPNMLVFGASNMIYMRPTSNIATLSTRTIKFTNLSNPAFSMSEIITITAFNWVGLDPISDPELLKSRKIKQRYEFKFNREVLPCTIFTEAVAISSSYIAGQNNVTFQVDFQTGHSVPKWGAISITFPEQYDINLLQLGASCAIKDWDLSLAEGTPTCKIGAATRVDIFLNGYELNQITRYSIEIYGVTTLNIDSTGFQFSIASYYYDNIFQGQKICQKEFDFPKLTKIGIKTCDMITQLTYKNPEQLSYYTFQFQCPEPVRDNTELEIILPDQYTETNTIPSNLICQSQETTTLQTKKCQLNFDLQGRPILKVNLQRIESQKRFTIEVEVNNPRTEKSDYRFSAVFLSNQLHYFNGLQNNYQFVTVAKQEDIAVADPLQTQVQLVNIPKNAGENSNYIFTIPPLCESIENPDQLDIHFPDKRINDYQQLAFDKNLGKDIQCGVYVQQLYDEDFFTYHSILELTSLTEGQQQSIKFNQQNYHKLQCTVTQDRMLSIQGLGVLKEYNLQEKWFSFIIQNIVNPSNYVPGDLFQLVYLKENGNVLWEYQEQLVYYIGGQPDLIKMKEISVSELNIKSNADYEFTVEYRQNFDYVSNLGISITLPPLYSDVVVYQQDEINCSMQISTQTIQAKCAIYEFEIFLWDIEILGINSQELSVTLSKIVNPVLETQCDDLQKSEIFYTLKLINLNSHEIISSTSPSVDDKNCIPFTKQQFNIVTFGSSVLQPGLSYEFSLVIEKPASGLKIEPDASINGIKFEPSVIEFEEFDTLEKKFLVRIRSDVLPGNYWVTFNKKENSTDSFYLPVLPFAVQVVDFNEKINDFPQVIIHDVETESIGYPITCPITLSQNVANPTDLFIDFENNEDSQHVTIVPRRILLDTTVKETSFDIIITTSVIPESITLQFSLSSFYPVVHKLTPQEKTIKFSRYPNSIVHPPSMHIIFSDDKIPTNPNELGQEVTQQKQQDNNEDLKSEISQIEPIIYDMKILDLQANSVKIKALVTQKSTIYYTYSYQASPIPLQEEILHKNYTFGQDYGFINTKILTGRNIDFVAELELHKLEGQSNYEIHMLAKNGLGYSEIATLQFKTTVLSYGIIVKIPIRNIVEESDLITALSKTLRITEERVIPMTNKEELVNEQDSYQPDIMINPNLYYEVAIAPNKKDDQITPEQYAQMLQQQEYIDRLDELMPYFDETLPITWRQIRQTSPKMQIEPFQSKIQCYKAQIGLRLWEKGKVFGVVIETENVKNVPYSNQIFRGTDEKNQNLNHYRIYSALTEEDGSAILEFDDLLADTEYIAYITVGNNLPYTPLMLYDDDNIRTFKFTTPKNINLQLTNDEMLEIVKGVNPELASALEKKVQSG